MISADDFAIAIQEGKYVTKTRNQVEGLQRVHQAVAGQLSVEVKKQRQIAATRSSRSRREVKGSRQNDVVDGIRLLQDNVLFAAEDARSRLHQFHADKNQLYSLLNQYLQRQEVTLVDQKSKWALRVSKFTQSVMDDLNVADPQSSSEAKSKANSLLFVLQHLSRDILAENIASCDYRLKFEDEDLWNHPLVLYQAMQALSILCQNESQRCLHNLPHHDLALLQGLVSVLVRTYEKIDEIFDEEEYSKYILLPLLLPIAVQATRSLAELSAAVLLNDGKLFQQKTNNKSNTSSDAITFRQLSQTLSECWKRHSFDLSDFAIKWAKRFTSISADQPLLSIIRKSFLGDCSVVTDLLFASNYLAQGLLKIPVMSSDNQKAANMTRKLSVIAKPSQPIATNPADKAATATKTTAEEDRGMKSLRLCHGLLSAALQLGAQASSAYAMMLGPAGHVFALVARDTGFYAVFDNEISAAMECIATSYSIGYLEAKALIILHDARNIIHHRYHAIVLCLAFLKSALAAAMCFMKSAEKKMLDHGIDYEHMNDADKDPFAVALGGLVEKVMMILSTHRTSLGICHKSLLLLRVLMREAFLKRAAIEDLCSKQLSPLFDPLASTEAHVIDDDEDEEYVQQAVENNNMNEILSLASSSIVTEQSSFMDDSRFPIAFGNQDEHSSLFDYGSSSLQEGSIINKDEKDDASSSRGQSRGSQGGSRGGTSEGPKKAHPETVEYLKKLKKDLMNKAYQGDQPPLYSTTLPALLHYIVETHVQTSEVMEQALLLVEHIAVKSSLSKYLLVEAGLPFTLTRYLDTQPDSLYIVALCEICVEILEL